MGIPFRQIGFQASARALCEQQLRVFIVFVGAWRLESITTEDVSASTRRYATAFDCGARTRARSNRQ